MSEPRRNGTLASPDLDVIERQLAAPSAPRPSMSPLTLLDDRLRGRWLAAIALGLVLGVALGTAGYRFAPVLYEARGIVRVAPAGYAVLHQTAENAIVPRYEGLLNTQATLVQTPQVIDRALEEPKLAALPIAQMPDARELIRRSLRAWAERGSELIYVAYESESPDEAQIIVNSVLRAYETLQLDRRDEQYHKRLATLRNTEAEYRQRCDRLQDQLRRHIADSQYGTADLEPLLNIKLLRVEELKQELSRLEAAIMFMEDADDDRALAAHLNRMPTAAELERFDPGLADLREQRDELRVEIDQMANQYSDQHLIYRNAVRQLELLERKIADRRTIALAAWVASGGVLPVAGNSDALPRTSEELKAHRQHLTRQLDSYEHEIHRLHQKQSEIDSLQRELAAAESDLNDVIQAIRILNIESDPTRFGGHVHVAEYASRPLIPSRNLRKAMTVAGFGGGISVSFALFFLLGTLNQRAYSVRQLLPTHSRFRCLGVLPHLRGRRIRPELADTATHCVHQIRNRIEALRDPELSFVFVVTSPYRGDGKTSLTMSLGWSYAAAGYRTLLIDADFFGRNLTRQMGFSDLPGLKEVLRNRELHDQIVESAMHGLYVLPAGCDAAFGPESIRQTDFATLCAELRRRYDVIIIDTGPCIGSVELLPVAAACDGVVFTLRRGRSRNRLAEAASDLRAIGIRTLGVVLNSAGQADCNRYASTSTVSAPPPDAHLNGRAMSDRRNALVQAIETRSTFRH